MDKYTSFVVGVVHGDYPIRFHDFVKKIDTAQCVFAQARVFGDKRHVDFTAVKPPYYS
jgi:ribosome biogenesis SPOUT family RNA methylase Rps3